MSAISNLRHQGAVALRIGYNLLACFAALHYFVAMRNSRGPENWSLSGCRRSARVFARAVLRGAR
jgi:hypothetical protein